MSKKNSRSIENSKVYGILNEDQQIVYIGVTSLKTITERLCSHVIVSRYRKTPFAVWLKRFVEQWDKLPKFKILEIVPMDISPTLRERAWVRKYIKINPELLNRTNGVIINYHPMLKYSMKQVREVIRMSKEGIRPVEIARITGISDNRVRCFIRGDRTTNRRRDKNSQLRFINSKKHAKKSKEQN